VTRRNQTLFLAVAASASLGALAVAGYRRFAPTNPATTEEIVAYRTVSALAAPPYPIVPDRPLRGAILIVGDGLGTAALTGARLVLLGPDGRMAIERMPCTGLLATHAFDALVPDSASAATALATGHKTTNERVAMGPHGERLRTLVEVARDQGLATGLVTVAEIADATPAAFGSHALNRHEEEGIAAQLVDSGIDVLLGAGARWFLPATHPPGVRRDGVDHLARARRAGYQVVRSSAELAAADGPQLLGLFDFDLGAEQAYEPSLTTMAHKALALVAARPRFFLMLEHEGTDTLAHHRDFARLVGAVRELDETVAAVIDFAERDGQTLVLVTADHETGGLVLRPGPTPGTLRAIWGTRSHSGVPVPLFAYGPHASSFTGLHDNTELPKILARLLGIPEP
jgi:alkaline phosphatase